MPGDWTHFDMACCKVVLPNDFYRDCTPGQTAHQGPADKMAGPCAGLPNSEIEAELDAKVFRE